MIKRYKCEIILSIIFALLILIIFIFSTGNVWGSETDWINQHFALPEYFRMRFYKYREFFPDFALNLGGGQNIYNFAYYGLFNPIYFPAYLMPWVRMSDYIQITGIITVYISCIMCMKLMRHHFNESTSFFLALIFMFSAPLIFHSHRHIMFIQYFPFLLLALSASENMELTKNRIILTLSSCCIMLSDFYFSISEFTVIFIYIVYTYAEKNEKEVFKSFKYIALGIIISGFLWIPVLFTLLGGRERNSANTDLFHLVFPCADMNSILYSSYSMGLTGIAVISAVSGIFSPEKHKKFLAWIFLIIMSFPVIVYFLNGGLYADSKILIPFIPLSLILCGNLIRKTDILRISVILSIFVLSYIIFSGDSIKIISVTICDLIISMFFLIKFNDYRRYIPAVIFGLICCITVNLNDNFTDSEKINEIYSDELQETAENITSMDYSFYRFANDNPHLVNTVYGNRYYTATSYSSVNNSDFRKFRFETSAGENQCRNNALQAQPYNEIFNILMGCRYRISENDNMMYGETISEKTGRYNIFRNELAFPVGYASANIMSEDTFSNLDWNEKAEALLENIITYSENKNTSYPDKISEISCNFDELCSSGKIRKSNQIYEVKSDFPFGVCINLENSSCNLIMIKFHADNRKGENRNDISVSINGVKNKLSDPDWKYNNKNYDFTYILSSESSIENLMFEFSKGNYILSDFEIYSLDVSAFDSMKKDYFNIDCSVSGGDIIEGNINVTNDGWFNLSVPYDKGFRISVDGVKTEYYKTNTAFIGFPIKSGEHEIIIEYHAPYKTAGIIVSSIGTVLFFYSMAYSVKYYEIRGKFRRKCFT